MREEGSSKYLQELYLPCKRAGKMELLEALDPKTSKHIPYDVQANLSNPYNQEVEEGEILPFPILGVREAIQERILRLWNVNSYLTFAAHATL